MLTSCSLLSCVASLPIPIPHYLAQLWALWMGSVDLRAVWMSACGLEHLQETDKHANCSFPLVLALGSLSFVRFQTTCFKSRLFTVRGNANTTALLVCYVSGRSDALQEMIERWNEMFSFPKLGYMHLVASCCKCFFVFSQKRNILMDECKSGVSYHK